MKHNLYHFLLLLTGFIFPGNHTSAQVVLCDTMTITCIYSEVKLEDSQFSTPDSAITIPFINNTTTNFAYPLAKLVNTTPLPPGMSYYNNNWTVFASSWNVGDTASAHIDFYVTQQIPANYTVSFLLYVSNFLPLSIDSCVFASPLSINLNPATAVADVKKDAISIISTPGNPIVKVICKSPGNKKIDLIDLYGRVLNSYILNSELQIDMSNYNDGYYFLRLDEGKICSRFCLLKS